MRPRIGRCCRFPRTRSIRIAAWRRTSASPRRARGRSTRSPAGRPASSSRRPPALLPRVSAPERLLGASIDLQARPGHRADRSRRAARRRRLQPRGSGRRARRVRDSRRHPRRLSRGRRTAGPARVHRRHDRVAAHLRPGDAAIGPADRSARSCRCATSAGDRASSDDRSVGRRIFDYLARRQGIAHHRLRSATKSTRTPTKLVEQRAAKLRGGGRAGGASALAPDARRRTALLADRSRRRRTHGSRSRTGARRSSALDDAGRPVAARTSSVRCQPAVEMHGRVRGLGRRDPAPPRSRARRRSSSPRRRAAPSGRSSCSRSTTCFAVPVERADDARYAAVLVAIGTLSRGFRLPDAGAADLRRSRRLRGGAPRAGAPPVGDQGVSLGPARPEGRRSRRPRRSRHRHVRRPEADRRRRQRSRSSSSCATPATTSCSCRSSGSISSRSTPARPGRRSTGSAAPRGSARRRGSRRPCATWPRSCSSSTPRARRCPATPSAADSHWQQEFEDAFEYELTPDQKTRDRRHQARHGIADADGSPAVRRRRLRQDRGGDARRVQGGDGRQAGRRSWRRRRCWRFSTRRRCRERFAGFPVRIEMVSRFRSKAEQKESLDRSRRRQGRHHRRHAPAAVEGRRVPRSRAAGRRRGAAVRRRAQGEDQAAAAGRSTC